jgi:uncharacterized protein YceK
MKTIAIAVTLLLLSGCAQVTERALERHTNSQIGKSSSFCGQVAMNCGTNPDPTRRGYYSEWVNPDGSVGCTCNY